MLKVSKKRRVYTIYPLKIYIFNVKVTEMRVTTENARNTRGKTSISELHIQHQVELVHVLCVPIITSKADMGL